MTLTTLFSLYHKPIVIEGQHFAFPHLEPFIFSFDDLRRERPLTYTLNVRFTNHCFSAEFDPARHTEAMVVWDGKQKRGFEAERYALSSRLPGIIHALPTQKVYQTWERRNYVAYEVLVELSAGEVYRVFLNLRKAGQRSAQRGCNLDLFVESAYPAGRLPGTSTVRFITLCHNTLNGIPVRRKR